MSREDDAPFSAELRRLREAAGLTQEELASRANLTAKAVGALERGERKRPYPHTVRALADALGLSEEERASLLETVPRRGGTVSEEPPDAALASSLPVPPRGASRFAPHGCSGPRRRCWRPRGFPSTPRWTSSSINARRTQPASNWGSRHGLQHGTRDARCPSRRL